MRTEPITSYIIARKNRLTLINVARTALATVASLLVARLLRLPQDYWAAVSCLIVMQSTLGSALAVSVQRFAGTAIGAAVGAGVMTCFSGGVLAFGLSLLAIGMACAVLRIERSAFRYAGIALAIVMLAAHTESAPVIALHRFAEVSLGIAVALSMTTLWPERPGVTETPDGKTRVTTAG
jgi:uncharacterized membrane protein YccC